MNAGVSLPLAFLAGLASFLSPCVLALVPVYVAYLGGRAAGEGRGRLATFCHGLAFVTGFGVVFVALGLAASAAGGLLGAARPWLTRLGGVVVIFLGLHMTGIVRLGFLDQELRLSQRSVPGRTFAASFLLGVFFSAGWSPCVGPVLGAILTVAAGGGTPAQGAGLLAAYAAGLAVPFLMAAWGIGWLSRPLGRLAGVSRAVEVTTGLIMAAVGVMLLFDLFRWLSAYGFFSGIDFGL